MDINAVSTLFIFFITTTLIIVAAHYATKFLGRNIAGLSKGKHIGLIEKTMLPGNLTIEIIKIGQRVYVIASKGKDLTTLDQFTLEEWDEIKLNEQDSNRHPHGEVNHVLRKTWRTITAGLFSRETFENRMKKGD